MHKPQVRRSALHTEGLDSDIALVTVYRWGTSIKGPGLSNRAFPLEGVDYQNSTSSRTD